ncbi:anaphase-promoting complex subunit 5-domain-containing protein [Dichotomocladium elegans]|nr:anaphase-promoting complex subunit 5-domain-containing protein [Dichotomocladium elegans]
MFTQRSVIRTRYLTPFKIIILILLDKFSRYLVPLEVTPRLVSILLDYIQTCDSRQDPSADEIAKDLLAITTSDEDGDWIVAFRDSVLSIDHPDKLFQFIQSLSDILEDKEQMTESWQTEIAIMEKTSILGVFVRRCRLEFLNSSILQRNEVFTVFRHYAESAASLISTAYNDDAMDIDFEGTDTTKPAQPSKLKPVKQGGGMIHLSLRNVLPLSLISGWWISEHYVEKFLAMEAERIEQTETSEISPQALDKYLNFLQTHAPDIGKIHQVRFVNYLRTAEYEGAVVNLHRFFDYCLLYRETIIANLSYRPMYHYALLNLGILEAKFGHTRRAMAAFEEALNVAREHQDANCLDEVLSWMRFMKGVESSLSSRYPKYTSSIDEKKSINGIYLECLDQLTQAKDMLRRGESPAAIFQMVTKTTIQSSVKNMKYIAKTTNLMKSCIWEAYGFRALSEAYLDLAKNTTDGTKEDIEQTYALSAEMHASIGNYQESLQILNEYAKKYPDQSRMSLGWKQQQCRIKHRMAQQLRQQQPQNESHSELQEQQDLWRFTHPIMPEDHWMTLCDLATTYAKRDCPEQYGIILDECHIASQRHQPGHLPPLAEIMIKKSQFHLDKDDIEGAIEWLTKALQVAKRAHDIVHYCAATVKLCEARLFQSVRDGDDDKEIVAQALFMLRAILPKVLTSGSLHLQSDLFLVYAAALHLDASENDHHSDLSIEYRDKAKTGYEKLGIDMQEQRVMDLLG